MLLPEPARPRRCSKTRSRQMTRARSRETISYRLHAAQSLGIESCESGDGERIHVDASGPETLAIGVAQRQLIGGGIAQSHFRQKPARAESALRFDHSLRERGKVYVKPYRTASVVSLVPAAGDQREAVGKTQLAKRNLRFPVITRVVDFTVGQGAEGRTRV